MRRAIVQLAALEPRLLPGKHLLRQFRACRARGRVFGCRRLHRWLSLTSRRPAGSHVTSLAYGRVRVRFEDYDDRNWKPLYECTLHWHRESVALVSYRCLANDFSAFTCVVFVVPCVYILGAYRIQIYVLQTYCCLILYE